MLRPTIFILVRLVMVDRMDLSHLMIIPLIFSLRVVPPDFTFLKVLYELWLSFPCLF